MVHIKENLFIVWIRIIKIQQRKSKTKYTESIKKEVYRGYIFTTD